mgnify:CR=1 FL=1
MLCLNVGTVILGGVVIFAAGAATLSVAEWWITRKFRNLTNGKP